MEYKLLFNEVAEKYDRMRPRYTEELFIDIIEYSKIQEGQNALEIGCGTGQALEPFLKKNINIQAIEIGGELAEFTRRKYEINNNLKVINDDFEKYHFENEQFQLVYSATAFHWISEDKGYKKVYEILDPNGTIALFWNVPIGETHENEGLYQKIESIYQRYFPKEKIKDVDEKTLFYGKTEKLLKDNDFKNIEVKTYLSRRTLNSSEYIELLDTYSDHRALSKPERDFFYNQIKGVIKEHNNKIIINNKMELYMGRK